MKNQKCLKYYLDSKIYSSEEVQKNIEQTKKEFPKKDIKVDVELNQFGMYIIKFYFENKNTVWNNIIVYLKKKNKTPLLLKENNTNIKAKDKGKSRLERYYGRQYGIYKETKTYRPY